MRRRSVPNLSPAVPNPKVVLRTLVPHQKSTILKLGPHSPFSRPRWGARGGGGCAGCLWARERYAMSALRLTSKAKLQKKDDFGRPSAISICLTSILEYPPP